MYLLPHCVKVVEIVPARGLVLFFEQDRPTCVDKQAQIYGPDSRGALGNLVEVEEGAVDILDFLYDRIFYRGA